MGLFSTTSNFLGLDIGASAIKVVSGKYKNNVFQLDQMSVESLPLNAIDDRGINDADAVSQVLRRVLSPFSGKSKKVSTGVRGSGVLTKRITIPKVPEKEIPDQVRWEAEQVFPTDVNSVLIDYLLLGEGGSVPGAPEGTKGWDLLLVGVRIEDADALERVIKSEGGEVKVMDLDLFSTTDFLVELVEVPPDESVAFVDVGASGTRVAIRRQDNVCFIREFPIAGVNFTETISQSLGLNFDDAEAIKLQSDIPEEAQLALQGIYSQWKTELQQCEDIFVTQDADSLVSRWYFYGGGCLSPGLLEGLQDERFGNKIFLLPFDNIFQASKKVDEESLRLWAPRLLSAAAFAMRKK